MASRRAIFLDRDGVLNADAGYTYQVADLRLLPGVAEALAALKARGFLLVVATNQSGIGRGLYTLGDAGRFHAALDAEIRRQGGAAPDAYYLCPHAPEAGCPCRKPLPGMLLDAAKELGIDRAASYMVGDRASDVAAAVAAGVRAVQVVAAGEPADPRAVAHAGSLREALAVLV